LKAIVTSATDKKAYFCDENATILTKIMNLNVEIINSTLNLKIFGAGSQSQATDIRIMSDAKLIEKVKTGSTVNLSAVTADSCFNVSRGRKLRGM